MENQKPKIEFYLQRDFSGKFNATADFIREGWKPLLRFTFYLLMPVCLLQTYAMNLFMSSYMGILGTAAQGVSNPILGGTLSFLTTYGVLLICVFIGYVLLSALVYTLMQTYDTRENRLKELIMSDIKENLIKNIKRNFAINLYIVLIVVVTIVVVAFIIGALAVVISWVAGVVAFFLILFLVLCCVPLMMAIPVYIFEPEISLNHAIAKTFRLGKTTLWSLLGFIIVISIISSVIQSVTTMPWYISILFGNFLSGASEFAITQTPVFKFAVYILGLLQSFGTYVSMILVNVGVAFHYFHAREKVEGITIESGIRDFDTL